MAEHNTFFSRFTAIYTDKSINGWVRGAAWVGTAVVIYLVGNSILSGISAAQVAQQQAARAAQLDNTINSLENPSSTDTPAQQPTFSDAQYSNFADAITTAFTGCDAGNILSATLVGILTSAGETVYDIILQFQNDVDFFKLQKAFGIRTITKCWFQSNYNNVDLVSAVNAQLDVQEIAYLNNYLTKQGFKFRF
jgi:hypothetical protein